MFWDRSLVDWKAHNWRLLGRRGRNSGTIKIADFRRARGIYVLYSDTGIYYVGLASSAGGIGGRLKDHTKDTHERAWTRFSWFAFDGHSEVEKYSDGVLKHEPIESVQAGDKVVIRELEALLQAVTSPPGNANRTRFLEAGPEWHQVAEVTPEVETFKDIKWRIAPQVSQ